MKRTTLFALFLLFPATAMAQQSTPGFITGQIPTASQWNSYFAGKLDYNYAGLPVNLGGTGAVTPSTALSSLGAMPNTSGAIISAMGYTPVSPGPNSNLTTLTGLTGALLSRGSVTYTDGALTPGTAGARGPLFVWTNGNNTVAGHADACQFWVGNNPTATPASTDDVACLTAITNGGGRTRLWAGNDITVQANAGGYLDGPLVGREVDVTAGFASSTNAFSYSGGYQKNGLEVYNLDGGFPTTTAVSIWSSVDNGHAWYNGVDVARVLNHGFGCIPIAGDATTYFTQGCFEDDSASGNVIRVTGTHTNFAHLASATLNNLFQAPSGADVNWNLVKNSGNHKLEIGIDAGASSPQQAIISFKDQGTDKWWLLKDTSNNFSLFNFATSATDFSVNVSTDLLSIFHGLNVAGGLTANAYTVGATAGVTCSGTPTSSFASVNGIVTHC